MATNLAPAIITATAGLLAAGVTAYVASLGAHLAHDFRRQLDLKTAERRLQAYAALWALFRVASPTRTQPMDDAERYDLHQKVTDWYYADGNGMLLTDRTLMLYLKAKANLTCPVEELFPPSLRARAPKDPSVLAPWRGDLSQKQLSLLRTQMKVDLAIYGEVSAGSLSGRDHELERMFLEACGVELTEEPWIRSLSEGPPADG
ncbi:hypothetical protein DI272_04360 [Streptomyces sp. Act143]|uniref:hypothetical protein n=1 Tax=Streptomyces sp. Act143 TaxID=2200760 RepID=UPI000D6791EB|nr:hypothetical protein [Streptomyces sp. Act143]PWI13451.1 hypothetical protein DI272_04360 [Streptomyces sp. Act143]